MDINTIVTQMTILLLIMIVGFVGAKKNIFNDEVNVYASNILLRIGIPGLIISSVKKWISIYRKRIIQCAWYFFNICDLYRDCL